MPVGFTEGEAGTYVRNQNLEYDADMKKVCGTNPLLLSSYCSASDNRGARVVSDLVDNFISKNLKLT